MNLLELFAGSRSVGNVAETLGINVFSVDWEKYNNINLAIDIELLEKKDIPFIPDIIWASPDCTTYTIAAISTHRNGIYPKSNYAIKCDNVNKHFIDLINDYLLDNPNMVFFIENPRGMLRKMPFMQSFKRHTIWYCKYGDTRQNLLIFGLIVTIGFLEKFAIMVIKIVIINQLLEAVKPEPKVKKTAMKGVKYQRNYV